MKFFAFALLAAALSACSSSTVKSVVMDPSKDIVISSSEPAAVIRPDGEVVFLKEPKSALMVLFNSVQRLNLENEHLRAQLTPKTGTTPSKKSEKEKAPAKAEASKENTKKP